MGRSTLCKTVVRNCRQCAALSVQTAREAPQGHLATASIAARRIQNRGKAKPVMIHRHSDVRFTLPFELRYLRQAVDTYTSSQLISRTYSMRRKHLTPVPWDAERHFQSMLLKTGD